MKPADEQRISKKIIAAQERLRRCMCKTAAAPHWHLEKAATVLRKPKLLQRIAPHLEDAPARDYLASLAGWIEQTTRQDAVCGELWSKQDATYPAQFDHLFAMLMRYDFSLRSYEKFARQLRKPFAETAASGVIGADEVHREPTPRMTTQESDSLQQQIDKDLSVLDQARAELIAGHDDLVLKLVQKDVEKTADPVEEVTAYARNALAKAAEHFDSRQGRRFASYAQWWIKTAIKEKKTWEK